MGFLLGVHVQGPGVVGGDEFDLETILARRVDSGTSMYFCQWEGYSQRICVMRFGTHDLVSYI